MTDGHPQSALREWRQQMSHPATLVALAGIGAVLGLAGPFGTEDRLPLLGRLAYWLTVVATTFGAGALVSRLVAPPLSGLPLPARLGLTGVASGVAIAAIIVALNLGTFGWWPSLAEAVPFVATLLAISVIVTVALHVTSRQLATPAPPETGDRPQPAPAPALLDRLPLDKRGPLVALSVEDHYTRVRTTKGQDLLLLRLSDAIRETEPTRGAQVHRSHWVAFAQVRSATRRGDGALLTLSDGSEIPVSRANVPLIREAGLLPR